MIFTDPNSGTAWGSSQVVNAPKGTGRQWTAQPSSRCRCRRRWLLRAACPPRRLTQPQTDWNILHGTIAAFRRGDIPVARPYLDEHAPRHQARIVDLLNVWTTGMAHPDLKREAETLRFGLRPMAA